jgi:hypothetical protein
MMENVSWKRSTVPEEEGICTAFHGAFLPFRKREDLKKTVAFVRLHTKEGKFSWKIAIANNIKRSRNSSPSLGWQDRNHDKQISLCECLLQTCRTGKM